MNYLTSSVEYQGFTLNTYLTPNGKTWVSLIEMSNATGVTLKAITKWAKKKYKGKEFLKVKSSKDDKLIKAFPLESLVDLLNYLQDEGYIESRRFTMRDLMESLAELVVTEKGTRSPLEKTVYLIQAGGTNKYKIGITRKDDVKLRMRELQVGNSEPLSCVCQCTVEDGKWLETMLHGYYRTHKLTGEWFTLTDEQVEECIDMISVGPFVDEDGMIIHNYVREIDKLGNAVYTHCSECREHNKPEPPRIIRDESGLAVGVFDGCGVSISGRPFVTLVFGKYVECIDDDLTTEWEGTEQYIYDDLASAILYTLGWDGTQECIDKFNDTLYLNKVKFTMDIQEKEKNHHIHKIGTLLCYLDWSGPAISPYETLQKRLGLITTMSTYRPCYNVVSQ